jgi:hypothetical protein
MKNIFNIIFATLLLASCADLNELDPINSVPTETAITDRASALAAINGVYDEMQDATLVFDGYLAFPQFFSDECNATGTFPSRLEMSIFNVQTSNTTLAAVYTDFYDVINVANNVIELIPLVEDEAFTQEERDDIVGQAKFMRAQMFMYLTAFWTDVPLVLQPTKEVGDVLNVPLSTQAEIYTQVESDLNDAIGSLTSATGPARASVQAAQALMARAKLYQGKYGEAKTFATSALADADITQVPYLQDRIYTLEFTSTDGNSLGFFYGTADLGGRYSIGPTATFINSFEAGDTRFAATIDSASFANPYFIKYPSFSAANSGTAVDPVLFVRHSEMVLIIAEVEARDGNFTAANTQLNKVRTRAGLPDEDLGTGDFVEKILQERFVEFGGEGAFRLIDLRRTGKAVEKLGALGYEDCDAKWPIPQRDIDRNINIVQNDCCNC